ncbi:MAG: proton-conducting transporter membrane subunit [Chloroflexia bacterium]
MSALITSLVAFPLAGFLVIALLRPSNRVAGYIATTSVALAFGAAAIAFLTLVGMPAEERSITPLLWGWVRSGGLDANVQFLYDPLSALMALIVTGISMLVHLYSIEYMAGDRSYRRYFAVLNLFVAMMLLLVLAANYLLLLVGWAGVGLSSYLLIGHWRERPGVAGAAVKAFVANTIGDLGLLLAMFIMVRASAA